MLQHHEEPCHNSRCMPHCSCRGSHGHIKSLPSIKNPHPLTHSFSSLSRNSDSVFGLAGDSRLSPSLTLPPSITSPADPYLCPASAFSPASSSPYPCPASSCSPHDVLTAFLFGLVHLRPSLSSPVLKATDRYSVLYSPFTIYLRPDPQSACSLVLIFRISIFIPCPV